MLSSSQPRSLRWLCRIYRLMLLAYPSTFRREYGREMALAFRNEAQDVLQNNGSWALFPFTLHVIWDWLQTIVRERKDVATNSAVAVRVNGGAVISLFGLNNVARTPDIDQQSRGVWLILTAVGIFLLVVGWLRWMKLMGIWP
jgi:hypothetical protein